MIRRSMRVNCHGSFGHLPILPQYWSLINGRHPGQDVDHDLTRDSHRWRAEGNQEQRVPGGDDARRRPRVRAAGDRRVRRDRRRRRGQLQRRRLPRCRRRDRADRRRCLGAADGREGQGAQGGGVQVPARRPDAVHLPAPRRLPRRRQGADRSALHRARLRDGADSTAARCRCWPR